MKNLPPPRAAMGRPQRKPENALLVPVGHSLPPDPSLPTSQWKSSVQLCDGPSIIVLLYTLPSAPTSHHTSNAHPRPLVRAVLGLKKEGRFSCPLLPVTNFSPSDTSLSPQAGNSLPGPSYPEAGGMLQPRLAPPLSRPGPRTLPHPKRALGEEGNARGSERSVSFPPELDVHRLCPLWATAAGTHQTWSLASGMSSLPSLSLLPLFIWTQARLLLPLSTPVLSPKGSGSITTKEVFSATCPSRTCEVGR